MNPIKNVNEQQLSPAFEYKMSNISTCNQLGAVQVEQHHNNTAYHTGTTFNYQNNAKLDCMSQAYNINHQQIAYEDGMSLSGVQVCSSLDVHTPNIHPIYNISIPSGMAGHAMATDTSLGDQVISPTTTVSTQHWHQYQDPPMAGASTVGTFNDSISSVESSYPSSITSEENDESCSVSWSSETEQKMTLLSSKSPHLRADNANNSNHQKQQNPQQRLSWSSMRKAPNNRRNTVSSFPGTDAWCDPTEKGSRRQSVYSFSTQSRFGKEEQQDEPHAFFCHLSREELIQRVVQLEREKQLNSKLLGANAVSSDNGPNSAHALAQIAEGSDRDEPHPCQWKGCDTSATTLDQLIVHIKDIHVGSGKPAYICEWASCPREHKPFLKRHKMQNHMRTHTGERPFECQVKGCDKRFSRPDSLNTHVKTHSSVRPYECTFENCGKAYFHSRSLRKHAKSHESTAAVAAAVAVFSASATINAPMVPATFISHIREEDASLQRQHPYNRSLKPSRYYRQQQFSNRTEACQQTPLDFTPMMVNTAVLPQQQQIQTQQQQFTTPYSFNNSTALVEACEQEQHMQYFAFEYNKNFC
ncbi:hypothetical protein [Parasitella parasitica]|uniref:C2H2-type domain-containing protein n=1 Tax=Parasitella parasitica TaxID=35722 RepID=A0A0B7N5J0_9FUNG|nr:hypothetical protein [Parasitella parasitica]